MHYSLPRKRTQGESWLSRLLGSRLFFLAMLAMVFLAAYSTTKAFLAWKLVKKEVVKLQREFDVLEEEEQELSRTKAARQDPAFQELEARRLGMKKPGEVVVVIVPPPEKGPVTSNQLPEEQKGWWASIVSKLLWWK